MLYVVEIRYDITKFKDAEHCKSFKSEICKRIRELNIKETVSINKIWKKIRGTIKEVQTEVLGKPGIQETLI